MHVQQVSASDAERVIAALHGKTLARNANPLFIEIVSQSIGIVYAMCGVCVCAWVCVCVRGCVCVCGVYAMWWVCVWVGVGV